MKFNCCDKPDIQNFDTAEDVDSAFNPTHFNRMCLRCRTHWYGVVRKYSKSEWDERMNKAESFAA